MNDLPRRTQEREGKVLGAREKGGGGENREGLVVQAPLQIVSDFLAHHPPHFAFHSTFLKLGSGKSRGWYVTR